MVEGVDCREQWDRVTCPTIQMKYITIRCSLNNKVAWQHGTLRDKTMGVGEKGDSEREEDEEHNGYNPPLFEVRKTVSSG